MAGNVNAGIAYAEKFKSDQWLNADGSENFKFRAWCNLNGSGAIAIRNSGNISSVIDNGVGNYTFLFVNAMQDANYAVTCVCAALSNGSHAPIIASMLETGVRFQINNDSQNSYPASDSAYVTMAIIR